MHKDDCKVILKGRDILNDEGIYTKEEICSINNKLERTNQVTNKRVLVAVSKQPQRAQ